jgi:hypothetical protein
LTPRVRGIAALAAVLLLAPVVVARQLTPDPRGWGTHEQLGWQRCRIRQWFDRPCPTCGMTTAWSHAVRGDIAAALATNVGGVALLAGTIAASACLFASATAGRWLGPAPRPRTAWWLAVVWLAVTLGDWLRRLAVG